MRRKNAIIEKLGLKSLADYGSIRPKSPILHTLMKGNSPMAVYGEVRYDRLINARFHEILPKLG